VIFRPRTVPRRLLQTSRPRPRRLRVLLGACGTEEDEQRKPAFCEDVPTLLQEITVELETVEPAPELERLEPELVDGGAAVDHWGKANC
jgi:hypothetical protein